MKRFSTREVLLILIVSLLFICCIGLSVISFICINTASKDEGEFRGRMVITEGAFFSEELSNSSSPQFKTLAFDIDKLVSEAYSLSDLRLQFKSCQVLFFSKGSVEVTFDLQFLLPVSASEVALQLETGLQMVEGSGLVIDLKSISITSRPGQTTSGPGQTTSGPGHTTAVPWTTTPVSCSEGHMACSDGASCVPIGQFCDGLKDCSDGSDEDQSRCATSCDGQFELRGPSGTFTSSQYGFYNSSTSCRWIIRVPRGQWIQVDFLFFKTEGQDSLRLYQGLGSNRELIADLSGSTPPGTVWLLSDQSTAEFISDDLSELEGFRATFRGVNGANLSNEQIVSCSFENGWCFWRRDPDQDQDWIRTRGDRFPPETGPSVDHTSGTSSGFYIVTPLSPGSWLKTFRIHSLPLRPSLSALCLSFWYHMFGEDIYRLRVLLIHKDQPDQVLFQKLGNYGNNWNYGQTQIWTNGSQQVFFEAQKNGGMLNDIALDDITLTSHPCGLAPPEPTNQPPPTTAATLPANCGGPFDLYQSNSSFSSPNYPLSYANNANCLWRLHSDVGKNIQLHFLDFDLESTFDTLEIRDGPEPESTLLGQTSELVLVGLEQVLVRFKYLFSKAVLTGKEGPAHDLFSSTNQMSLWLLSDTSGSGRGFKANFSSGVNLGSPEPCAHGLFRCGSGSCIEEDSQCDGRMDCSDGSDEANCVFVEKERLLLQMVSSNFSVCSMSWTPHLSDFTCRYLGYRSGDWVSVPSRPEDSPFVSVSVSNNSIQTTPIASCETVVSLSCSNQPCGVRQVNLTSDSDQSQTRQETDQSEETEDSRKNKVVGGADAVKGAWPWIVSLHWRGRHVCGATLIGRDWLLTAAHCVYGKNVHVVNWRALLGLLVQSQQTLPEVQSQPIRRIVIHPLYNRRTKQADVAMMQLEQPISFSDYVQPACLPEPGQDEPQGTVCSITGWGRLESGGDLPDILQQAQVPLVSLSQCQSDLPQYNITSLMVCAGLQGGGVDSCQGDSGGPLMSLQHGHWTQIGVTSFGAGCGRPQSPGVYARVSAFSSWIAQTRRSYS